MSFRKTEAPASHRAPARIYRNTRPHVAGMSSFKVAVQNLTLLLKNCCVVRKKTSWLQNAAHWKEIVSLQINFFCLYKMLNHAAEAPVEFRFILSTTGTLAAPHSAHFISSGASSQLIHPEPRSFSELVWALYIVPLPATKCLPVTKYELGTSSRINIKKDEIFLNVDLILTRA